MSNLQEFIQQTYQKEIAECSNEELYIALLKSLLALLELVSRPQLPGTLLRHLYPQQSQ